MYYASWLVSGYNWKPYTQSWKKMYTSGSCKPIQDSSRGFYLLICITLESKREKLPTNSSAIVNLLHAIISWKSYISFKTKLFAKNSDNTFTLRILSVYMCFQLVGVWCCFWDKEQASFKLTEIQLLLLRLQTRTTMAD